MSDLDTDLYGDLYGDDNEFAVPVEESNESRMRPQEHEKTTTSSTAPVTSTDTTKTKSPSPPPSATRSEELQIPSFANGNAPQPIQSYESFSQDYSSRADHGYRTQPQHDDDVSTISSLQVVDRHVRPSEMKDEG
ncbi:uncharacterized protein FOMMEDRAFT_21255 [Fomitiporia mediterranea MF3/22]|uniref:uncharacterized protein n=1 Tax=Fomitiporia mediterranea (strain MF3/22) TaxID=694068 RepID=UPI0004409AE0|nr:uncharacterized protein FOMMEDRAFT_21255 [Fomitiporia mediterranea MF3/22]EJD00729.1 hypothetical protein FOMMEDRAFT_21255 [Fomitiporia mediterranea MF3/22]